MNERNIKVSIEYFSRIYMKEQLFVVSAISVPISAFFFVLSLFYDVLNNDIYTSFIPILLGVCYLCLACFKTFLFKNMIRDQEKYLKVSIDAENLTPLYPKTLLYTSDLWFIKSGCWAFHKAYLKKITVRVIGEKTPSRHYVVEFHTIGGDVITDSYMSSGEIRKLKEWYNQ